MVLSVENVCKSFYKRPICTNISFDLSEGELMHMSGPSGCGKTTLLNLIAGMMKPDQGSICIDHISIQEIEKLRSNYIGYLPCGNSLLDSLTIEENIQFAAPNCKKEQIATILCDLGIDIIKNSYPREISSGEYKRACFARVLALNTPFLVLDEPTSNLDVQSSIKIIDKIKQLSQIKGIIVSTHDKRLIDLGKEISLCPNVS